MLKLFKNKSLKSNTKTENISLNERTQEKAILKEGIGTSREATCTRGGCTRASLFGTYTPSKMAFSASGRSMVEMLGVLAIIGVLSIGGISGYTIAMRRYRANEIVEVMNKYATILYNHCQMKMQNDPIGYPYLNHCNWDPQYPYTFKEIGLLSFTDAGLGPLPNGVVGVASGGYNVDYGSYYLTSSYSHDIVEISILLNDQKLCEVISDMMNEKERGEHIWVTPCQEKTVSGVKGYPAHLAFYVS